MKLSHLLMLGVGVILIIGLSNIVSAFSFNFRDDFNTNSITNIDNTTWNYNGSTCNTNGSVARCQERTTDVYKGLIYKLVNASSTSNITIRSRMVGIISSGNPIVGLIYNEQNSSGGGGAPNGGSNKMMYVNNYFADGSGHKIRMVYNDGTTETFNLEQPDSYDNGIFRQYELTRDNKYSKTYWRIYDDGNTLQKEFVTSDSQLSTGFPGILIFTRTVNNTIDWVTINYTDNIPNIIKNNLFYLPIIEQRSTNSIAINITVNQSEYNISAVRFFYNNTFYSVTNITNDQFTFNTTFTSYEVTNISNFTMFWEFNLSNSFGSTLFNSSFYSQIVTPIITTNNIVYNIQISENTYNYFFINMSFNTTKWNFTSATINYNNITYSAINLTQGLSYIFNTTITSPFVNLGQLFNFFWTFNLTNSQTSILVNSSIYNQQVNDIISNINISATSCGDTYYNFTMIDEENLTKVYGQIDYNFQFGGVNGTTGSIFGRLNNASNIYICFNNTASSSWIIGSGEIAYTSDSYIARRYYIYDGHVATNNTENISLYNLLTSRQTSFQLIVQDISLNPYVNKFGTLLRWYPNLNEYRIVEMQKTDTAGNSVLHVRTEDVDYRVSAYERDGTLIQLNSPTRFVCLVNPCSYSMKIISTGTDYSNILKIDYSLFFNYTTGYWMFTYSDPTQTTSIMNMTIYSYSGVTESIICSRQTTGYTGAMSCNTSAYSGMQKAVVTRYGSPGATITSEIAELIADTFNTQFILWLVIILAIAITMFFVTQNPFIALIGVVIALIPGYYFKAIPFPVVAGAIVLVIIVSLFIKRDT